MSRTTPVGLGGYNIWVHSGNLAILLVEVIRAIEEVPPRQRPPWWPRVVEAFRSEAHVTDMFFDLDLGLTGQQRDELAQVFTETAQRLSAYEYFTPEQAAGWEDVPELSPGWAGWLFDSKGDQSVWVDPVRGHVAQHRGDKQTHLSVDRPAPRQPHAHDQTADRRQHPPALDRSHSTARAVPGFDAFPTGLF